MLLTAHVRWLQTGPTYDGNVGVARFRDFSPMRTLEIWFAGYCLARRARRRLLTARRPRVAECAFRWRYMDRQKYGLLAASYNSPRGLDRTLPTWSRYDKERRLNNRLLNNRLLNNRLLNNRL